MPTVIADRQGDNNQIVKDVSCFLLFKRQVLFHRNIPIFLSREVPMVLPEPYFSLSDSRDTSCAIRFFSEPVPQLRDS